MNKVLVQAKKKSHPDDDGEIPVRLLEAIGRDPTISQRHIAKELGIALGLVNTYIKRCVAKGLIKVRDVPARRYSYYLTAHGFAEKTRLTTTYLRHSFSFFRNAREECTALLEECAAMGRTRVLLAGRSDLAEIMILCATECDLSLMGIIAPEASKPLVGVPMFRCLEDVPTEPDVVIVTDLECPQATYDTLVQRLPAGKVVVPRLLRVITSEPEISE